VIPARAGSLAARHPPLVTITQIDLIAVMFTLPEQELPALQQALRAARAVTATSTQRGAESFKGKVSFVDNAVDTATGTIRVKAEFSNPAARSGRGCMRTWSLHRACSPTPW
jgi:multidrug efflux pump subunit AcrA (membrane-fusion protein)